MNKLPLVFALMFAISAPAFAGPCVVLEYQEMKDMSADELVKEHCKAVNAQLANMDEVVSNLGSGADKPFPTASDNFDQCTGQLTRIERVLASKGITKDSLKDACSRQAAGQTIKAPGEAK